MIIRRDGRPVATTQDIAAVRERLQGIDGVAAVTEQPIRSTDGQLARLDIVFADDPFARRRSRAWT